MTLQEKIREEMKNALKAKDETRLLVMRGLLSAFTNELVNLKRTPQDKISDEECITVITRLSKQRKDSIEQFRSGGREDLALSEEAELKILNEFLPEMMSVDEVRKFVEAKKSEMGIDDASKKGMFMGSIMKDLKGKADGNDVKNVIDSLF